MLRRFQGGSCCMAISTKSRRPFTKALKATKKTTAESANDIVVHSELGQPIDRLGRLRQSLLFAELSNIAYLPADDVKTLVTPLGFERIEFFDHDGSQAYLFRYRHRLRHLLPRDGTQRVE